MRRYVRCLRHDVDRSTSRSCQSAPRLNDPGALRACRPRSLRQHGVEASQCQKSPADVSVVRSVRHPIPDPDARGGLPLRHLSKEYGFGLFT